jgi:NADH-quinone oxidoreductase subunit D
LIYVPIGTAGDTYDRFMVRQHEVWESYKIIEQAYKNLPEGDFHADVPDFIFQKKQMFTIKWKL